jgi:hypothetical protein
MKMLGYRRSRTGLGRIHESVSYGAGLRDDIAELNLLTYLRRFLWYTTLQILAFLRT